MTDTDYIQELHDDLFGALSADPGMEHVSVYQSRTPLQRDAQGDPILGQSDQIEEMVKNALAGTEKKNGKAGLAVVVLLPDVEGESVNSAAPAMRLIAKVRVIENRMTNEGAGGTGIPASKLSLHVLQVLNRRSFRGRNALYPDLKRMISEIPLPNDERCHEVTMIQNVMPESLAKVATPTVAQAAGQITLACTTAGAAIYYTLDGSYPGSSGLSGQLYTTPISLDPGMHSMRVAAQKAGMQASDDLSAEITIE